MWSISPIAPLSTTRFSSRIEAKQRLLLPLPSTMPASRQAATARAASFRVSASGFSHQTGFLARATVSICGTWSECGVARNTACTAGSAMASARSVESLKPCWPAKPRTSSGSLLTP